MKTSFTKKQRHEIYKTALVLIRDPYYNYICKALSIAANIENWYGISDLFPEFKSFEPEGDYKTNGVGWWDYGKEIRISVLEQCIEQTK